MAAFQLVLQTGFSHRELTTQLCHTCPGLMSTGPWDDVLKSVEELMMQFHAGLTCGKPLCKLGNSTH